MPQLKYRLGKDIRNIFEHEEEDYSKLVRVNNFWSNNYIEYKSKGDRKTLLVKKYLNKIKPYLKDIISSNLKKSYTWKIQLPITINFISFEYNDDDDNEKSVVHSKRDNKEIMNNDKADEVIKKLFESLLNRYQNNLEESMQGSEFVFNYVHSLYYKCHEINPNYGS